MPRPQPLLRFQPRTVQRQNTCSCQSSQNRPILGQFRPVGDRCSCGNSAVVPAIRPPCTCQVGQDDNCNNNNNAPAATDAPATTNGTRNVQGRRGMLGLFGLRGALGQLGRTSGIGGISLNTRVLMRPPTNANSIIRQANNENDADSFTT